MKTVNIIYILTCLLIISFNQKLIAQLYEVPFEQRLQQSSIVLEGKVVNTKSYRGDDEHIYTINEIQAFSILKGNLQTSKISVITFGGIVDGEKETWSHMLNLKKNEIGLFFLKPTNRPLSDEIEDFNNVYEVYSSSQGFLKYEENGNKIVMATAPFSSYQKNDLIETIRIITGQFTRISSIDTGNPEDLTGVEYSIQNISIFGNVVDFDIYIEGLWGSYDLTRSELIIEYDPIILGPNISTNGVVSVTKGTVSNSSNYNLSVGDINPNELSIKIEALNTGLGLHTITNLQEQLVHVQIASPNAGNPNMEFDEINMQQLSEYLDQNNLSETFQKVFAVGSINDIGGSSGGGTIQIDTFYPPLVGAGVDDTLTIVGSGFGFYDGVRPPVGDDFVFNAAFIDPNTPAERTTPFYLKTQYILWKDDTIKVRVPSVGKNINSPFGNIANSVATGKIGIKEFGVTPVLSNQELYVKYSVANAWYKTYDSGIEHVTKIRLSDQNFDGGYDLYYSETFDTLHNGQAKKAFERALITWRCNTQVNFRIQSFSSTPPTYACKIDYNELPAGVSSTAAAVTKLDSIDFCGWPDTSNLFTYLKKFDIIFSDTDTIFWHTDTTKPTIWTSGDTLDLETVALHEIGHGMLLEHTNNLSNVMFPFNQGYIRELTGDDLEGGQYTVNYSSSFFPPVCASYLPMLKIFLDDCEDPTTSSVVNVEPIENYLSIVPNPHNGVFKLLLKEEDKSQISRVEIFDTYGRNVYSINSFELTGEIDVSHLSVGHYFIVVFSHNNIYSGKFIKL